MASVSTNIPRDELFSKEFETLGDLKNFYLNILGAPEEYNRRVYNPSQDGDNNENDKSTDVQVNPKPQLVDKDIEFQRENFHNLKLAYLEQETKEKFVRAVVSDPPLVIEASDISSIEAENNHKKKVLGAHKDECRELQRELEAMSQEVCMEYENMVGQKTTEALELIKEMRKMQEEIDKLEEKHARLKIPEDEDNDQYKNDPEMVLPLESIRELVDEYNSRIQELETNSLVSLKAELDKKSEELQSGKMSIQDLTEVHERAQKSAQETVKIREQELKRGLEEKEATAKWYRNMLYIFNKATGITEFSASEDMENKVFTFKLLEALFEMVVNCDTGMLTAASVQDPLNRINDEEIQKLLIVNNDLNRCDPSRFLCQVCFILGDATN